MVILVFNNGGYKWVNFKGIFSLWVVLEIEDFRV